MNLGYDNKREKSKAEICMLIPYFGKFPEWFNLYLYSCSKVKKIDFWLLFFISIHYRFDTVLYYFSINLDKMN